MLSYQDQYELFQSLASDADATNLAMAKTLITQGQRELERRLGIYFTEETRTIATVTDAIASTSNQDYKLPENFKSLTSLYVTSGTTKYTAELIQDEDRWRFINATSSTSNFLSHCFIRQDRVSLFPIPSSTLTATLTYDSFSKPLVNDDYTTGTITTLAALGTAVTGSSTVWTAGMVGRYFRIDLDGEWYKVASRSADTAIVIDTKYQGAAISAGSATYTIGQMPITPADTHILPVYYAVWKWSLFKKDIQLAREFERQWKEGINNAQTDWGNRSSSNIIPGSPRRRRLPTNSNFYPESMT